jgi:hypothetical protein
MDTRTLLISLILVAATDCPRASGSRVYSNHWNPHWAPGDSERIHNNVNVITAGAATQ